MMNKETNYTAPYAEIVEVNLLALTLFSGAEQKFDPTGGETITYPADESKEW